MKNIKLLLFSCIIAITLTSCFDDLDDKTVAGKHINNFVWKAMNVTYAYKDKVPDLFNDRFSSDETYNTYLNSFSSPEDLFESVIYERDSIDEFSVIYKNYLDLELILQGITQNNGMEYGIVKLPNANADIIGYVRYVLPNTDAESKGITRGMIFNSIDGTVITQSNFLDLTEPNTYTVGWAEYDNNGTPETLADDIITSNNETTSLTKSAYTENPILMHKVLNVDGIKIGYLMYNNFRSTDENLNELNSVFAEFQSEGITDLVLDLRYNGGGSVSTAIWLASMITGQFTDEIFFKEKWNNDVQTSLLQDSPESLVNPFVDEMIKYNGDNDVIYQQSINSMNATKVYVITTQSTASASELVLNGLAPHLQNSLIQVGSTTRGKPQASRTVYDSPNFTRQDVNPSHKYALQPLVYESENSVGFSEYYNGIDPTLGFEIFEHYDNLGQLGNENERLLAEAIADITGFGRSTNTIQQPAKQLSDQRIENPFVYDMVDNRPLKFDLFNE